MPKIRYIDKRFTKKSRLILEHALRIIEEFAQQNFTLTLRQLYYQFVARELIPNKQKEYKKLGVLVNDARLAGIIDWDSIEDRTRFIRKRSHWNTPADIIEGAARGYGRNLWEDQDKRVEVWIEKDALVGVFEGIATKWDVPLFSCRGYASQSEVWRAAMRHVDYGKPVVVLHFGDHDPSGMDMTRDIEDRLRIFGANTSIERLALNMPQVKKFKLPPNPAKVTDSRFQNYEKEHGTDSWELDAMNPRELVALVDRSIEEHVDSDKFDNIQAEQETERSMLQKASKHWSKIEKMLRKRA